MSNPVFNWVPPDWGATKPDLSTEPISQPGAPSFSNSTPLDGRFKLDERVKKLQKKYPGKIDHVKSTRQVEGAPNQEQGNALKQVPHPKSDVRHIDPGIYTPKETTDFLDAIAALDDLEGQSQKDGEVAAAFQVVLPPLRQLAALFDRTPAQPLPKGMQRLKLVFENTLCSVTTLLGEMNAALKDNKQGDYLAARKAYIELLEDLDNHEPTAFQPGELGYGATLKWAYINPIIDKTDGKIKGAVVQAKWIRTSAPLESPFPMTDPCALALTAACTSCLGCPASVCEMGDIFSCRTINNQKQDQQK